MKVREKGRAKGKRHERESSEGVIAQKRSSEKERSVELEEI